MSRNATLSLTGEIGREQQEIFESGMDIGDDKPLKPAKLVILTSGEVSQAEVFITEGRFHQIKRMFEAVGSKVLELKRLFHGKPCSGPGTSPGTGQRASGRRNQMFKGELMLKDKRAVIFDLDGTLVDSMWIWREIDERFLGQYGLQVPDGLNDFLEGFSFNETAEYF